MRNVILMVIVEFLSSVVFGAMTTQLSLDCRGAKVADNAHPLVYDASWHAGGVTARITANGREIVSGTAGEYAWTDPGNSASLLTLTVFNAAQEIVGSESVWCLSHEDMTKLAIPERTTGIGAYAFQGGRFTSVTIPESVTNVAMTAFAGCSAIESVSVPSWMNVSRVFADSKTNIIDVVLSGPGSILSSAFSGCTALSSVAIPAGVTNIGSSAFSGCGNLVRVEIPSLADWLVVRFGNATANPLNAGADLCADGEKIEALVIPEGTTEIGPYAFQSGMFTSVTIPESVTNVAMRAFSGCSSIESAYVPSWMNVSSVFSDSKTNIINVVLTDSAPIPSYAFSGCTALPSVSIPAGVTKIGSSAFSGCGSLVRVEIPSLTDWLSIRFGNATANPLNGGAALYADGEKNEALMIPEGTTEIGAYAFQGGQFTSVAIPESVTNVAVTAFAGCCGIESVSVPSWMNVSSVFSDSKTNIINVTLSGSNSIPTSAFSGCTSLSSVTIPASVKSVGSAAFSGCRAIASLCVPSWMNVSSVFSDSKTSILDVVLSGSAPIPSSAFSGCTSLSSVTIPAGVTNVGASAFSGCRSLARVEIPSLSDWLGIRFGNAGANPLAAGAELHVDGVKIGESLVIPEGTTEIGAYAFQGGQFASVTIPAGVTNVGASAFSACGSLARVEIPSLADWLGIRFGNAGSNPLATGAELHVGGVKIGEALVIPEGTTEIGAYAFQGGQFASVTIPESVTNVAATAFSGCTNIVSVGLDGTLVARYGASAVLGAWMDLGDGQYRSMPIGHGGASEMSVRLTPSRASTYSFRWKVSSESGCDKLEYYVDDIRQATISGSAGWATRTISLSAGEHTICWRYSKDGSVSSGEDCGWVDVTGLELGVVEKMSRLCDLFPDLYRRITSLVIGCELDVLDVGMLAGCSSLEKLVLPEGLREIKVGVLADCVALKEMNIPAHLVDFGLDAIPEGLRPNVGLSPDADGFTICQGWLLDYEDRGASAVTVPNGVIGIGHRALAEMYDLETVSLPSSLRYIADEAFAGCSYLDDLRIPDGVETIGTAAFADCSWLSQLTLGAGVRYVGERAFAGCTQLHLVAFGDGLETVGAGAFDGCWRLQSVALPLDVKDVDSTAFTGCTSLTGVTVPTHQGTLSQWFAPVYGQIKNVTVPRGETEITADMFADCSALETVELPNGITNLAAGAFSDCSSLADLALPQTLQKVGDRAFAGCSALMALGFPENVVQIGTAICLGCASLADLALPKKLAEIPDKAFEGCASLDSFVVPASVTRLGRQFCPSGTISIYYLGDAPAYDANAYASAGANLTSYVIYGTKGWDGRPMSRDLPQNWLGHAISTWEAIRFDVTFDANGGTFAPASDATYACEQISSTGYSLPPFAPLRKGYKFNGYWTEPSGGTRVTASTAVTATKAHTLYARWTEGVSVQVRFNAMGGTVVPQQAAYTAEEPFGSLPVPTREHYDFAGWFASPEGATRIVEFSEVPKADQELFAHWTPCRYTIRFHAGNGTSATIDQPFEYGQSVTLWTNTFSCADCTFAGWALNPGGAAEYADGKTISEVSALEDGVWHLWACWTGNTYAVHFDSNGGVGAMPNQTFVIGAAQPLSRNTFKRDGFVFAGWAKSTDSNADYLDGTLVQDLTTTKGGTVDLFAVWMRVSGNSRITFEANGGTVTPRSTEYASLAAYGTLPTPARTGYTFSHWARRDGTEVTAVSIVPQMDVTLYAVWTPNRYTARFDSNGGTGMMADQELVYDADEPLAANVFERPGFVFRGWALRANAPVAFADAEPVRNLSAAPDGVVTLYAKWGSENGNEVEPLWPADTAFSAASANVYDGILVDVDNRLVGTVQVKTTKRVVTKTTNTKTKAVTVTTNVSATAMVTVNGKKWSYAGGKVSPEGAVAKLKCPTKGCPVVTFGVMLGRNGLEGEWGEYGIYGARQVNPGTYAKSWTVSFENGDWVRVKVDSKGGAQIVGFAAGKAYSGSARLVVGDGFAYVPVVAGKNVSLVRIEAGGTVAIVGATSGEMAEGGVTGRPQFVGWDASANNMVGVAFKAMPVMGGLGWPMTFKASNLPTGCKINAKTGVISGVPTKAGRFAVKITATSAGNTKWISTCVVTNTVVALPEWARGQFVGGVGDVPMTATVGTTGKISGKFKVGATNWTFAASSFAADSVTQGTTSLVCRATAKGAYKVTSGKKTVTKTVTAPICYALAACPDISPIAAEGTGDFAEGPDNVTIRRVAGIRLAVGSTGGTVKMDKSYGQVSAGGKVKLTATLKKGYAFLGWFDTTTGQRLSQATAYSLAMTDEDRFVTAEFAKESDLPTPVLDWNAPTNFPAGVSYAATPKASGEAAVKIVSMSGLPAGLVFKSGKVSGAPTTAKTNTVSVKVALATNAKKFWTLKQRLVVEPLPAWVVGTFDGGCDAPANQMKLTVSSNGKVSGKMNFANAVWTLSGTKITKLDRDAKMASLSLTATKGGTKKTVAVTLSEDELGGYAASTTAGFVFEARQNLWKKDVAWAELAAALVGEGLTTSVSDLTAVFGANGTVTAKLKVGKNVFSGSAVLCPTEFVDGKVQGRVYLYFAPNTAKKFKGAVRVVATGFLPEGVQLWEGGPYWAECNVGATKPEEYGYYFWWGDTVGYKPEGGTGDGWSYFGVTWVSSTGTRMSSSPFRSSSCPTYNKNNYTLQSQGYIDATGNLVAKHDAATAHLGAPWRMPTDLEFSALISNCTTTWTTRNGVYGMLVTGKGAYASKSIFLPAAGIGDDSGLVDADSRGYYWSSTPWASPECAGPFGFDSGCFLVYAVRRLAGQSVRPLRGFAK